MDREAEVRRARHMYGLRDRDPALQAMWAPFAEGEVSHRTQQYWAFATLLGGLGRLSLSGLKILDVGCGQGRIVRWFLDLGASPESVVGVDIRTNAIQEARKLAPHLEYHVGNGMDLDFPGEEFDLVTQFVVFSSIFSKDLREHLAREMVRVLKRGGYIFWWDMVRTVEEGVQEPLQPDLLFPGIPHTKLRFGMRPRPSQCLRLPRKLQWVAKLFDRFGYPSSHIACLIGPKPVSM